MEKDLDINLINKYDVVFNHTALEHIFEVNKAFQNLCRMSKDIVIVIVPFLQQMHYEHNSYKDYWRFTPFALDRMFKQNNVKMIYCATDDAKDHSIYVLAVGSKNPDEWNHKLRVDEKVFKNLGEKIIK